MSSAGVKKALATRPWVREPQVVQVGPHGSESLVSDALAAITDASEENPYVIQLGSPIEETEGLTWKDWITLDGLGHKLIFDIIGAKEHGIAIPVSCSNVRLKNFQIAYSCSGFAANPSQQQILAAIYGLGSLGSIEMQDISVMAAPVDPVDDDRTHPHGIYLNGYDELRMHRVIAELSGNHRNTPAGIRLCGGDTTISDSKGIVSGITTPRTELEGYIQEGAPCGVSVWLLNGGQGRFSNLVGEMGALATEAGRNTEGLEIAAAYEHLGYNVTGEEFAHLVGCAGYNFGNNGPGWCHGITIRNIHAVAQSCLGWALGGGIDVHANANAELVGCTGYGEDAGLWCQSKCKVSVVGGSYYGYRRGFSQIAYSEENNGRVKPPVPLDAAYRISNLVAYSYNKPTGLTVDIGTTPGGSDIWNDVDVSTGNDPVLPEIADYEFAEGAYFYVTPSIPIVSPYNLELQFDWYTDRSDVTANGGRVGCFWFEAQGAKFEGNRGDGFYMSARNYNYKGIELTGCKFVTRKPASYYSLNSAIAWTDAPIYGCIAKGPINNFDPVDCLVI